MRLRLLLAATGSMLFALSACTSDLPAPPNYIEQEPPAPPNELALDCDTLARSAVGATVDFEVVTTGRIDGASYEYEAIDIPAGLSIDNNGVISGTIEAEAGNYEFEVIIKDANDPEKI
nr:putative Ig domain-containing protein [Deltaproteobacteria bacterium]